jgi:hypothetical protein
MPFRYFHGFNNGFVNNTCVALGKGYGAGVYSSDCDLDKSWTVHSNKIYTVDGNTQPCGKNWSDWIHENKTRDFGTTVATFPEDDKLIGWAEALLNFSVSH